MSTVAAGAIGDLRRRHLRGRHGFLNVAHVLATHGLLAAWFWLGHTLLPWPMYLLLSPLACLAHQRAMSEWIHEGAHYNLVPGRWNDPLTNLLVGMPFLLPVSSYRAVHFAHHRAERFFVPEDPDTAFLAVPTRRAFRRAVAADLCGLTLARQARRFLTGRRAGAVAPASARRTLARFALGDLGIVGLLLWAGRIEVVLVYYGTFATLYALLNRLRTYVQHVSVSRPGPITATAVSRTTDGGLLDRCLHTSARLCYHHEHHRWPALPWRALAALVEDREDPDRYVRRRAPVLRAIYRQLPP